MNEHSAIVWTAIVAAIATITTGVIAFFGGKNSASAQMQAAINLGFKTLTQANNAQIAELRGDIRNLEQYVHSLESALRREGISLPERPLTVTVFAPFPKDDPNG